MEFVDRLLTCVDCGGEFIFTAGEQLFFLDKNFKNDPKRCKPCKSKRAAGVNAAAGSGPAAAGISRTETRTMCSECGIETTVPFKPTQGRPVLCRSCFQLKGAPSGVAAVMALDSTSAAVAAQVAAVEAAMDSAGKPDTISAATMEMIAEAPAAIVSESEAVAESVASEATLN